MKVALYARVSSERQVERELSIPGQLKALREFAEKNGHVVVREFADEAETGRTSNRPAFGEMIALSRLKHSPFEAILVWKLSRFARNREDSIIYKSLLKKQGIQVISINEPIEDSPSGRLLEGIIEVIDEFYSANLAQDVTRGMRDNAARGYLNGGRTPYGYKRIKVKDGEVTRTTLQLDEITAPIVERIFSEYLKVKGTKEIAKELSKNGVKSPRGKKWAKTSVYGILANEAYIGTMIWGKTRKGKDGFPIRVENAWPSIIDRETFDKVQSILASRSPKITKPRSINSNYLLGGMMKCAECGAPIIGCAAKSGQFFYYRCNNALRRGPEACRSRWLPKSRVEQFVIDKIRGYILTDENLAELMRMTNEEIEALSQEDSANIKMLNSQIRDVDSRLEHLYDALETGKFGSGELAPRIHALTTRKAELECAKNEAIAALKAKKLEVADIETMRHYVEDLRSVLGSASIMEQKAFLRSFVKRIDVSNSEVTINYTLPMPPLSVDKETVAVLGFIRSGGRYWT